MSKSGQIFIYGIVLLLSCLLGYWFYNNFTWVDENKEVGFQGIAKTNDLLAAEFFLRKMGVLVQQVNGLVALRDLPSTEHTLFITTQRETINKELSNYLLTWLKSGGHAIVEAKYLPDSELKNDKKKSKNSEKNAELDDELLKEWSLFAMDSNSDKKNEGLPVRVLLDNSSFNKSLNINQYNKEIEVNFPFNKTLNTPASRLAAIWSVEDETGQYLIQFSVGAGLLNVHTSTLPFNNEQIADYDHAQFLHYLVQQPGHNAGVWLIRVDDMPPLWQWLWDKAWYAMFSLSLLFIVWLWRAPFRFGPILNDTQMERRSLLEHIRASGYYRWHNDQSGYLLEQVQNRLWTKIQKSHPAIRRDNQLQAYKMLEDITGINETLITEALLKTDKINEHDFTNKIKLLELIYQHL